MLSPDPNGLHCMRHTCGKEGTSRFSFFGLRSKHKGDVPLDRDPGSNPPTRSTRGDLLLLKAFS